MPPAAETHTKGVHQRSRTSGSIIRTSSRAGLVTPSRTTASWNSTARKIAFRSRRCAHGNMRRFTALVTVQSGTSRDKSTKYTALATTYLSPTELTAVVPAALISKAGDASVEVDDAAGTSNVWKFTINRISAEAFHPATAVGMKLVPLIDSVKSGAPSDIEAGLRLAMVGGAMRLTSNFNLIEVPATS